MVTEVPPTRPSSQPPDPHHRSGRRKVRAGAIAIVLAALITTVGPHLLHRAAMKSPKPALHARITYPTAGTVIAFPTPNPVTVRLNSPLPAGEHLWFAVLANTGGDEWHPARRACTVTGTEGYCDVLYAGSRQSRSGTFQVALWLTDADANQQLQVFAQRPVTDNSGIAAPDGAQILDNILVSRG